MNNLSCDIPRTPQLVQANRIELVPLSSLKPTRVLTYYQDNKEFHEVFSPTAPINYYSEEFWQQKIWRSLTDWQNDSAYRFMIRFNKKEDIIGNINLTQVFRGPFQNGILGYSMHRDYQGLGLMSEAVDAFVRFTFEKLKLHRIQAATLTDNLASQRILEKTGFHKDGLAKDYLQINGRWQDHFLFSIINENY